MPRRSRAAAIASQAQAARIRALIDEKDNLTLVEIQAQLAEEGHHFSVDTLWRFFARYSII
ncbi:MAG: hypothetical protein ABF752_11790 [Acetobacter fabarum]|uniref:hypothetical protein n=1 Tax=Acetobacter fabarum TaxID=483199 RepID=UPI0039E9F8E1